CWLSISDSDRRLTAEEVHNQISNAAFTEHPGSVPMVPRMQRSFVALTTQARLTLPQDDSGIE
ncbi:MAG TPA: hypothetical protein VJP04_13380, partial [Terriglobales bacterium]|nr:hypothetical protein [Terriglobales bacterium]